MVGLYLDPPAHAIVLCVDEKSQIQALERTQPVRPLAPERVERRTHDYRRHGTTTLFAALEVATGLVTDACQPRHRHSEFLGFLKVVARAYPRRQLHVVLDNYATHKHERMQAWLFTTPAANHQLRLDPASGVHSGEGTQAMDPQQQPGTAVGSWSVDLAVCAEMVFLDLPVPERVRRIADLGFQAEIWDWTTKDLDTLARTGPGSRP